jgi:hypothetical protein
MSKDIIARTQFIQYGDLGCNCHVEILKAY